MKKIIITGSDSYIGTSFEKWLEKEPDEYSVDTIDMRTDSWKKYDFSGYDVVFHVAGIAHVTSGKKNEDLYYRVNRDLAIEAARKAKEEGVKQFIFMSSIIVYTGCVSSNGVINKETVPDPHDVYGGSKHQAEIGIKLLESPEFKVVILRSPMVYGKNSKGNYRKLAEYAKHMQLFPDIDNKRSMIHIDNLCEFVKLVIDFEENGLFFPQNKEYVKTSDLVKAIAKQHGRKIRMTRVLNPIVMRSFRIEIIRKLFGNLVYEKSMSEYPKAEYIVRDFLTSVELSE